MVATAGVKGRRMFFMRPTDDAFNLERGHDCIICGAFRCSCQTWLVSVVRRPDSAPEPPEPQAVTVSVKTYTRKTTRRIARVQR
jgi:hypothetical protein